MSAANPAGGQPLGAAGQVGASMLPAAARDEAQALSAPARSQTRQTWDGFRAHRMAFIGFCVLVAMIVICVAGPLVLPQPDAIDYSLVRFDAPSAAHPLGTDSIGRDVLSRLVNAGRTTLLIGFMVAFIAAAIGASVGVVAGYFGGRKDAALMWFVNVLMSIPSIVLLLAISVLSASPDSKLAPIFQSVSEAWRIIIVLSSLGWMGISRVVRSQVISLREQEFVEAARALGGSDLRVMFLHILPNSISVIAVFTTLAVSGAIIAESALSFLGFGVQAPTATWGNMLAEGRDLFTILQYWWTVWFPALAIFITVLSVNFVGDGVRDALDPKTLKK